MVEKRTAEHHDILQFSLHRADLFCDEFLENCLSFRQLLGKVSVFHVMMSSQFAGLSVKTSI